MYPWIPTALAEQPSGQCADKENQQSWPGVCPASANPPANLCSTGWIAGQTQKRHLNGFLVPFSHSTNVLSEGHVKNVKLRRE